MRLRQGLWWRSIKFFLRVLADGTAMRRLLSDENSVLFEPVRLLTGILIACAGYIVSVL
ncbi:MAG: hypothetical protein MK110_15910 [Fuerstiella sp.]|nr:hypothetical protein [Fuerstiella sp.]